jgi:hypothetical protein
MSQDNETKAENTNEVNWDTYLKSYFEKPSSFKSWSGLDVKDIYTPEAVLRKIIKKTSQMQDLIRSPGAFTPICSGGVCGPKERLLAWGHLKIPINGYFILLTRVAPA